MNVALPASPELPRTLLVDRFFDGERFVTGDHEIRIERGKIHSILPAEGRRNEAVTDLRGKTVLPGLIDAHCHIARVGLFEPHEAPSTASVAANLHSALRAGVTTAGDMGCPIPMIASLGELTRNDLAAGPALRAAGPLVTVPLGYPLDWMSPLHRALGAAIPCADRAGARRAVARVARAGMDHVKICIMHRAYDLHALPTFSQKVARAVVDEAHASGLRVFAHAHWNADYRVALAAGVDALMHSAFDPLDAETVARVADAGIPVCPTLWVFHSGCLGAEQRWDRDPERVAGLTAPVRRSWRRFAEAYQFSGEVLPEGIAGGLPKAAARLGVTNALANLLLLREKKVPFAYGSDGPYGFSTVFRPFEELSLFSGVGFGVEECLRTATLGAAELLGLRDRGAVRLGAVADLIWLDGDLTRDLSALRRVSGVLRSGVLVPLHVAPSDRARAAVRRGIGRTLLGALRGRSA